MRTKIWSTFGAGFGSYTRCYRAKSEQSIFESAWLNYRSKLMRNLQLKINKTEKMRWWHMIIFALMISSLGSKQCMQYPRLSKPYYNDVWPPSIFLLHVGPTSQFRKFQALCPYPSKPRGLLPYLSTSGFFFSLVPIFWWPNLTGLSGLAMNES
jgi:hypothetical protein